MAKQNQHQKLPLTEEDKAHNKLTTEKHQLSNVTSFQENHR